MNDAERDSDQATNGTLEPRKTTVSEPVPGASEPEELKKAFAELDDKYLRLAADFENFRRRTSKEREALVALANERFAVDLLEVMDNFDRALKSDDSHLREGLEQIRQLLDVQLQRHGVMAINSLNKPFNPEEHEAIAHIPSGEPEGKVVDEVAKGYKMNEKVIRYAKVAVSKGNHE